MTTSRRELLKIGLSGAAVVSLSGTMPAFLSKFAFAQSAPRTQVSDDNILVVIQLTGGNDGLNTVVPFADDVYHKSRGQLAIKDKHHKINDQLGLHPALKGFKQLFDDGQLAIVNGCGYPKPNRSHFEAMNIWHAGDPQQSARVTGWLGHYIDHQLRGSDSALKAVSVGTELPLALSAQTPVPSIMTVEDFALKMDVVNSSDVELKRKMIRDTCTRCAAEAASPALEFLGRQASNAIIAADQIKKLTTGYKPDVDYPGGLGQQLRLIAQIIAANFGTKLFYCQLGSFDTHANQLDWHERLLAELGNSLAAFHKDLAAKKLDKKVTVMCFSEFGRRVVENNSRGTDHGTAAPMFISGGRVKGGMYCDYPSLTDLQDGDLKHTTDFRRVYATLLDKWLNSDSTEVLRNKFEAIDFI